MSVFSRIKELFSRLELSPGGQELLCSGWTFLTAWRTDSLGRVLLSSLGCFQISSLHAVRLILREIVSVVAASAPVLVAPSGLPASRRTLVFSWFLNTPEEYVHDRYLGRLADDLDASVGRVGVCLGAVPGRFEQNLDAYFVFRRTFAWNLRWLLAALAGSISPARGWRSLAAACSVERRNAVYMRRQLASWLEGSRAHIERAIFPYEQQPWQCEMIRYLTARYENITTIGYIHSSLNNVPVQFVKHRFVPAVLYVHGGALKRVLSEELGWDSNQIKLIDSLRFDRLLSLEISTIFLPYGFTNSENILNSIRALIAAGVKLGSPNVRLHPVKATDPRHLKLKKSIEELTRGVPCNVPPIALIVGVSTVMLEALEAGYEVYAIFEDASKDALPDRLWLEVAATRIDEHCFRYELREKQAFIRLPAAEHGRISILAHTRALSSGERVPAGL